jgi:YVTN family beta-propeller protein
MKKLSNLTKLLLLAIFATIAISCNDDDPEMPAPTGSEGFFIVNEGAFGNENASLSFYDRNTDMVINNIFEATNGRSLGDQAQSMAIHEDFGYVVVQNSQKIEVINIDTYQSTATISDGLPSPRYFQGIDEDKAYVSDWGADGLSGTVKVLDLNTNEVVKTISTGAGSNRMLLDGSLVYVTNGGGFGVDNTIDIINTNTDEVVETINVGDNPNSIVKDAAGNFWVTSSGATAFNPDFSIDEANSTLGTLSRINSANEEILRLEVDAFTFSSIGNLNISPNGQTIYYTYNGRLFSMNINETELPTTPFREQAYYGLSVDPTNGNIIGAVAPNFSSAGFIEIISPAGTLIDTHNTGIGPNGCAFK